MARTITAGNLAAAQARIVYPHFLVYLNFRDTPTRYWTGRGTLSYNGESWVGVGDLGTVGPFAETTDLAANGIQVALSGVSSANVALMLGDEYRNRELSVWLAFRNGTHSAALIVDALRIFKGRMSSSTIQKDPVGSTITITAESELHELDTPKTLLYDDREQQRLWPGDDAFEHVAGRPAARNRVGGSGQVSTWQPWWFDSNSDGFEDEEGWQSPHPPGG